MEYGWLNDSGGDPYSTAVLVDGTLRGLEKAS